MWGDHFFMSQVDKATGNLEIIKAITVLAHNLQMIVTAEDIEADRQLQ